MAKNSSFQQLSKLIRTELPKLSASEIDALVYLLKESDGEELTFPEYKVPVDYDKTVEDLVREGKYDWANSEYFTVKNFPSAEKGKAEVTIFLLKFDQLTNSEFVVAKMDALGLRPATLKELLSLGISNPNLQKMNEIVALGSWCLFDNHSAFVPVIYGAGKYRCLNNSLWNRTWSQISRFAAVRI